MAVVVSEDLVLSPPPEMVPLKNPRIGWQTWTEGLGVSAVDVSSGDLGDAPLRPDTFEWWRPGTMPATWRVDLGEPRAVDYVAIAGHTLGSEATSVQVEYSNDDSDWTAFGPDFIPAGDAAIMILAPEVTARYWRLSISGGSTPRIAVVYVGLVLAMPHPIYGGHSPAVLSRDTSVRPSTSEGGQFLGQRIIRRGYHGSAEFRHLPPSWYRDEFDPFVRSMRRRPYFFAWRPATYPTEIIYAKTDDDIQPQNMGLGPGWMQVSWSMIGLGNDAD